MLTVIIGRRSNLTQHLVEHLDHALVVSSSQVLQDPDWRLPAEPHSVVVNCFQPATALSDFTNPQAYIDLSIGVTARLASSLRGSGCVKVLYTSSAAVYGDNVHCVETEPAKAASLHAALKLANEQLVGEVCAATGIACTMLRLFNMYGGNDQFSVIARIQRAVRERSTLRLYNDGNELRDFVYIEDAVHAYVAALGGESPPVLNVATGVGVSVRHLVGTLRLHGIRVSTMSQPRNEILASVADVSLLSSIVDVSKFSAVEDYLLASLADERTGMPGS